MPIETWNQFGFGVGTQGVGNLINTGTNMLNSWFNYRLNEKAANNADKRQRAMYNDLYSPAAKLQQYRDAGISPSLAFSQGGAGGAGGATAPQGAGAAGPGVMGSKLDPTQLATIENIQADTNLKDAERNLIGEQAAGQKLQNYITQETSFTNIYKSYYEIVALNAEIQKTLAETEGINWQNAFNDATKDVQINLLVNKNANLMKDLLVKDSQISLNEEQEKVFEAQCVKWQWDTYQKWVEMDIQQESIDNQKNWFNDQVDYFYDSLDQEKELKLLDLKQRKTQMWLDFGSESLKTLVYGGTMIATGGVSGLFRKPSPIGFK